MHSFLIFLYLVLLFFKLSVAKYDGAATVQQNVYHLEAVSCGVEANKQECQATRVEVNYVQQETIGGITGEGTSSSDYATMQLG